MSENKSRKIVYPKGINFFNDLALRIKLILRLMGDRRVSPLIKLLPIGAVIYLVFPDLVPGPIDDAAILWLATYLFVELCPPDVVQEHLDALKQVTPGEWREPQQPESDIVDAEFWEKKEDQ